MAENKEKLFDQFPGISYEEWRAKVEADLKGADFNKKLVWRTNEGFNVQPIYRAEDTAELKTTDSVPGQYPYVRGTRAENDWLTRQEIIADSVAEANAKAKDVLTKGITSLGLSVPDADPKTIETLLDGIKQRVLLRLAKTMDFIDEENRGVWSHASSVEHLAHLFDAAAHRVKNIKLTLHLFGNDRSKCRLAHARRSPEYHRRNASALYSTTQNGILTHKMLLSNILVQRSRTQSLR